MNPWTPNLDFARFVFDSQCVIALRMIRLAAGGKRANREAQRMIVEKGVAMAAAQMAAAAALVGGAGPSKVAKQAFGPFKRKVSRNRRRLSRGR